MRADCITQLAALLTHLPTGVSLFDFRKRPRLTKVLLVEPFRVFTRWSTGEIRLNDYNEAQAEWLASDSLIYNKLAEWTHFCTAEVSPQSRGILQWPTVLIDLTDIRGEVCYVPLDFDPLEMYRTGTLLTEEEFEVILKRETYDFDTELSYAKRSLIDALGHTSLTDSQVDELKIIIQEWLGDLMAKGEIKGFELGVPDPLEDTDVDLIIGGSPPPTAKDFALISYAIQYHKINGRFPSAQEYQMAETMCADIWTFFNKRLRPISGI